MNSPPNGPTWKVHTTQKIAFWVALNLAYRSVHREIEKALKAEGLPPLRWYDVLWELERADGGMRPFELERSLLFEQSNLSRMLRRIINDGLVEERAYEGDGRGKVLLITAKGLEVRRDMWTVYGPQIERHFGDIGDRPDAGDLIKILKSLIS